MSNNQNNIYNEIGRQIKESLSDGLNTGDFSGLNDAISDSVKAVINEAVNGTTRSYNGTSGNTTKTVTSTSRTVNVSHTSSNASGSQTTGNTTNTNNSRGTTGNNGSNYGYHKPHSTPSESQAYAEELRQKQIKREEERRAQAAGNAQGGVYSGAGNNSQNGSNTSGSNGNNSGSNTDSTALRAVSNKNLPANFNPVGKGTSIACIVGGAAGTFFTGIATVGNLVSLIGGASPVGAIVSGILLAGSLGLMRHGINEQGMLDRAKRYAQICGDNMYAKVSSLASGLGIKASKVRKDIKKMLKKGYFPEGYIDEEETTLMISSDVYKEYERTKNYAMTVSSGDVASDLGATEKTAKDGKTSKDEKTDNKPQTAQDKQSLELQQMISEGQRYTTRLHELNDSIPGEVISLKLDNLEKILKEIFTRVEQHPEQMNRMHKLMDYYLPTMIKLVEAYDEYDKVSNPGADIISAKAEIENTLDTINEAFVQLLNNLFQDSVWDVTSDAEVLQTMLKQEGLTK